jgi:hypothetical protein
MSRNTGIDGLSLMMPPSKPSRIADWVVLLAQMPGQPPCPAGILLLDTSEDRLHMALATVVSSDEDIREVWKALREDLADRASELGGAQLLAILETDLSHFIQLEGPRRQIPTSDPVRTLESLYQQHVVNTASASRGL